MGEVYLAEDRRLGRKVALRFVHARHERRFASALRPGSARGLGTQPSEHPDDLRYRPEPPTEFASLRRNSSMARRCGCGSRPRPRSGLAEALDISGPDSCRAAGRARCGYRASRRQAGKRHGPARRLRQSARLRLGKAHGTRCAPADVDSLTKLAETKPGPRHGHVQLHVAQKSHAAPRWSTGAERHLFSLGIVLYEMLTGIVPFVGSTPADVLGAILYVNPLPLSRMGSIPDALARVVERALRKAKEERYTTMHYSRGRPQHGAARR